MPTIRKLPECRQCQFYARSNYVVCAIHPKGVLGDSCIDFRPEPDIKKESWASESYSWYGGNLIQNIPSRLTQGDRLHLLQTHPLFKGKCPECGHHFNEHPEVHWDCPECHWKDDSV